MVVMSSSSSKIIKASLASQLAVDFKQFKFIKGDTAVYSPKDESISYRAGGSQKEDWTLLHELAHGLLEHKDYSTDFELLKMESEAWHKAKKIGQKYKIKISDDYIQNCLDTYRDWLHKRSTCPVCNLRAPQKTPHIYRCFNCKSEWSVSHERFVRPYRLMTS